MPQLPLYALAASLLANLVLLVTCTPVGRGIARAMAGLSRRRPVADLERRDDTAVSDQFRSQPSGRVYGELQSRVATPLRVESAGTYAERRGLSPAVRANLTRALSDP